MKTVMATVLAMALTAGTPDARVAEYVAQRLTPKLTKYIPHVPTLKQRLYLCLDDQEALYGGAAGGGKSDVLLMSALQYVDIPGYAALILRRTFSDLVLPGALLDRAHQWLRGTDAHWNGTYKSYFFPSGARVQFGHLDTENNKYRYQSSEFQTICMDELTQFSYTQYTYMNSRLRRLAGVKIPLRLRGGTNPGGVGHEWVKKHFKLGPEMRRTVQDPPFIKALLKDNPHIDQEAYIKSLMHLDPVTRRRLLNGDWTATDGGSIFDRSSWKFVKSVPQSVIARVRFWDLAATIGEKSKRTAGVRMSRTYEGRYVVEHCIADKWLPGARDQAILNTAKADGKGTRVLIEEEPGSGGITQNDAIIKMLSGYIAESQKATGDKFVRAGAFASQVQVGNVNLVEGPWNEEFIEELYAAEPGAQYLDRMDGASGGFNWLAEHARIAVPPDMPPREENGEHARFRDNFSSTEGNPMKDW